MKRIYIKSMFIFAVVMITGINIHKAQKPVVMSDMAIENVEALAEDEGGGLDCNYLREEGTCTIHVGVGGSVRLFTMEIIHADSQGNITFDGKVVCSRGGSSTCKPIECYDLYQLL